VGEICVGVESHEFPRPEVNLGHSLVGTHGLWISTLCQFDVQQFEKLGVIKSMKPRSPKLRANLN
jgi:hypothetical protein